MRRHSSGVSMSAWHLRTENCRTQSGSSIFFFSQLPGLFCCRRIYFPWQLYRDASWFPYRQCGPASAWLFAVRVISPDCLLLTLRNNMSVSRGVWQMQNDLREWQMADGQVCVKLIIIIIMNSSTVIPIVLIDYIRALPMAVIWKRLLRVLCLWTALPYSWIDCFWYVCASILFVTHRSLWR